MAEGERVTVFRSAEASAEEEAAAVRDLLAAEGLAAELLDDKAPGVPQGACEVRVAASDAARADAILAANPPESGESRVDGSHALDLETAFGAASEMEAMSVAALLDSYGISTVIVGDAVLPNLTFDVRVSKEQLDAARQIIADAQNAGPVGSEDTGETS